MTLHATTTIVCDRCGAELAGLPAAGPLRVARERRWRRGQVGGLHQDWCPRCVVAMRRAALAAELADLDGDDEPAPGDGRAIAGGEKA